MAPTHALNHEQVAAYLERIGIAGPSAAPDTATLRRLHTAHLHTVPFENLSIHLGEPVVLDGTALFEKLVERRRGGFCYELNGLFALLLEALGYRVHRLSARTFSTAHGYSPPLDHLALQVTDDTGTTWLADVGFGRHTEFPLRFDDRTDQKDPGSLFRIAENDDAEFTVLRDGEAQYRVDPKPLALTDFTQACWWQCTSPESHFTQSVVCSRLTGDDDDSGGGRLTLTGDQLIATDGAGQRQVEDVTSDEQLLRLLRDRFGIELAKAPRLPIGRS
ncbi:arylamine N-acetyltransferase [Catenulispora sp. NL8]|uniref:Arylamine N-acetyltransferase n=1 Tax=Catenulispora pinistramenti TaxID=2705254 RepID=A0ABS5L7P4_9ACTN|nr:arylamine N-acetyltransferase [Catenulispora pinistramenti]MBS2554396.1 arylamine N-acetyltransferase [Catenulispora pinistramenti]